MKARVFLLLAIAFGPAYSQVPIPGNIQLLDSSGTFALSRSSAKSECTIEFEQKREGKIEKVPRFKVQIFNNYPGYVGATGEVTYLNENFEQAYELIATDPSDGRKVILSFITNGSGTNFRWNVVSVQGRFDKGSQRISHGAPGRAWEISDGAAGQERVSMLANGLMSAFQSDQAIKVLGASYAQGAVLNSRGCPGIEFSESSKSRFIVIGKTVINNRTSIVVAGDQVAKCGDGAGEFKTTGWAIIDAATSMLVMQSIRGEAREHSGEIYAEFKDDRTCSIVGGPVLSQN